MNVGIGIESAKPGSRVLKPPGGGHSDIFAPPELKAHPPRAKYDQQNSSHLNEVMGTTDPNLLLQKNRNDNQSKGVHYEDGGNNGGDDGGHESSSGHENGAAPAGDKGDNGGAQQGRVRVPPGGFSAGFW